MPAPEPPRVDTTRRHFRLAAWLAAMAVLLLAYILSAGPVLALACRLRDVTGWEGFDAVLFLYLPLYPLADIELCEAYLMWWMELFDAVPPLNLI